MTCHSSNRRTWIDDAGLPTDSTEPAVLSAMLAEAKLNKKMTNKTRKLCDDWIARRGAMIRDVYKDNPHTETAANVLNWKKYNGLGDVKGTNKERFLFLFDRGWALGLAATRVGISKQTAETFLLNR